MALGIVLSPAGYVPGSFPYEINKSAEGFAQLCPADPYYLQRGEYGFYHDTPLGDLGKKAQERSRIRTRLRKIFGLGGPSQSLGEIPTDAEHAKYLGWYTPVKTGWVATAQGYYPSPWVPPHGGVRWWGPPVALGEATADDVARILDEHQKRMFNLSVLSTTAVVGSSIIAMYRTWKLLREEQKQFQKRVEEAR